MKTMKMMIQEMTKRDHIQRIKINPDDIGECDDENDKDYK